MGGAPLNRDPRPVRSQRVRQSRLAVDDRQDGPRQVTRRETRDHVGPARRALVADESPVEDDALAVGAHAQRHQHRDTLAASPDTDVRIPAVPEYVATIFVDEIAHPPRLEVVAQTADESRDRIFRQRPAAQQRRQGSFDPTGVATGEIHAETRFIDPRRPPLIPTDRGAAPLRRPAIVLADSRARHRNRRRAQARRQRPLPRPVAIALPDLTHTGRRRCAQRRRECLFHHPLDRFANLRPHPPSIVSGPHVRISFSSPWLLGTVLHRVILRHPPPSGRSS